VAGLKNSDNTIHNLCPLPDINKTINPRTEHVTRTGESNNALKNFVKEPERNLLF